MRRRQVEPQAFTPRALQLNAWIGGAILAAWLTFWILRNLPGWPLL